MESPIHVDGSGDNRQMEDQDGAIDGLGYRLFCPNMPKRLGASTIRLEVTSLSCTLLANMSNFVKTGRKVSAFYCVDPRLTCR
jgi:hypothetical protein